MRRRRIIVIASVVASVVVSVWAIASTIPAPIDERTLVFRAFLAEEGVDVQDHDVPEDGAPAMLMLDARDGAQTDALLNWVRDGGRLIVTDPFSPSLESEGISLRGSVAGLGRTSLEPECITPESDGVGNVDVAGFDAVIGSDEAATVACYPHGRGAYLIRADIGRGRILALGGSSFLENDLITHPGNARLVLRLVGDADALTLLPPAPPGTTQDGLWDTLPSPVRAALFQLLVAAVVFAVVRGRRLGKVPSESPLIPISANELVRARAGLYKRARARTHGADANDTLNVLAERIARSTDIPADRIDRLLAGRAPETDVQLTTLERELEDLARATEGVDT